MSKVVLTAEKLERRKKLKKILRIAVLILLLLFGFIYLILAIIYKGGNFTVTLDKNSDVDSGLVMYEELDEKNLTKRLYAKEMGSMDNISYKWIPEDINEEADGAHNGDNYIAYTFYIENEGESTINYWIECNILDVIKNVDEAIRVMLIQNGEKTIYAKLNSVTNAPEEGTIAFYDDDTVMLRERETFNPGDIDKYTVVIWLEGDDDDCVDALIGGEIKMNMVIRDERIME